MRTIAILAASTVLAAVGGTTAAFAYTSTQGDDGGNGVRVQRGDAQPPSFVRSAGRVVPVSSADGRRTRHAEPGDDHGRHVEPGDDHGRHVEPGDDHGRHAEPGDHGGHGRHGGDDGGHHRHGSDG